METHPLAITRSIIIEKHGGDICVKSQVGTGTEFTLSLPINGRVHDVTAT